jgi:uncharacterized membrane protein
MVTRPPRLDRADTVTSDDGWLPAGRLEVSAEHAATIAFNRFGDGRLRVELDHEAGPDDLALAERAAELLPHLRVEDLDDPQAYRERHADVFELPAPLPGWRFNQTSEIEVVAPGGGRRLPARLGPLGIAVHHVETPGEEPDAEEKLAVVPPEPTAAERAERAAERAADGFGRALGAVERRLVAVTRLDIDTLCGLVMGFAVAAFAGAFVWQTWAIHERFGSYGFDLGIFDQGTWLLSRLGNPFVTVRGLHLFGDHASFILILVAPLYWLWADPRLLLLLQVVALAVPAVVIYRIAAGRLGHAGYGLAGALAYLLYPAMQWAAAWQFHPETLAAAFLAGAVLAADEHRPRTMAAMLALAMLCKEDVGLVVAGFGVTLWLAGRSAWGKRTIMAGLGYFVVATFVLIPLANGRGSPHTALNYGIEGSGPVAVLLAVPELAGRALTTAFANEGLAYLALILLPLALLPLLGWRALLPVVPPVVLNLAAVHGYQLKITYQYLATSSPFLVLAAVAGLAVIAARRRVLAAPVALVLVAAALVCDVRFGPALWSKAPALGPAPPQTATRHEAFDLIPDDAAVSAQYNFVPHLAHRRYIYEFPNPYRAANWGLPGGEQHDQAGKDRVEWIVVEPASVSEEDRTTLRDLRRGGGWRTVLERDGLLLLQRNGARR